MAPLRLGREQVSIFKDDLSHSMIQNIVLQGERRGLESGLPPVNDRVQKRHVLTSQSTKGPAGLLLPKEYK